MKNEEERDQRDGTEPEDDTEGQSMFLYEGARQMSRDHEREAQEHARESKLLNEGKPQKRRWLKGR